ncbi:hypothetical protein TCSYLVIO_004924 [Trypanosoma cruzi]|nr:hypothetical protein TCSYLVIO_004924 [Trypanosoma cruzi]
MRNTAGALPLETRAAAALMDARGRLAPATLSNTKPNAAMPAATAAARQVSTDGGVGAAGAAAQGDPPISRWRLARDAAKKGLSSTETRGSSPPAAQTKSDQILPSDKNTATRQFPSQSTGTSRGNYTSAAVPSTQPTAVAGAVAQEGDPPISRWRLARDALGGKFSPQTGTLPPKGVSMASGVESAASRPVEPRKLVGEKSGTDRGEDRTSPPSVRAPASNPSDEKKGNFSSTQLSRQRISAGGNAENLRPSGVATTSTPEEEKMPAKSFGVKEGNPTYVSASGNKDNERPFSVSPARGKPYSWTRPRENTSVNNTVGNPFTGDPSMGKNPAPQASKDEQVEWRKDAVSGLRHGRMSPWRSSIGTPYAAPRSNATRARSQPISISRSRPPENEELMRFLGAYGTPPRRSTGVFPPQQMDEHSMELRGPLIPTSPYAVARRSLRATTPSNKYCLLDGGEDDYDESSKVIEEELSSLLNGLEAYQKRLERAALVVSLERQRRRRH